MGKFKKILFPFFNEKRHDFLRKTAWARLLIRLFIVLYTIGITIILVLNWLTLSHLYENWHQDSCMNQYHWENPYNETQINCMELLENKYTTNQCKEVLNEMHDKEFNQCGKLRVGNFIPVLLFITLISTIIIHYFIQLILFKLIIDFIILGDKD